MRRAMIVPLLCLFVLPMSAHAATPVPGPPTIAIEAFEYLPSGTVTTLGATGAQQLWIQEVPAGVDVTVINLEPTYPTFQHTVTECASPCLSVAHPTAKTGGFDTGIVSYGGTTKTIASSSLTPGVHDYFCKLHDWMRGSIQVLGT
ncbi:MAG: hypothetical protein ABR552_10820 [Actinomycetota bacterium]